MADPQFTDPRSVDFDVHRWYVIITVVDRFGTTQQWKASADAGDTGGDGISFEPVDTLRGAPPP